MTSPTPLQAAAAERALRFLFPDLQFVRSQLTPEAASFSFEALRRVNIGSRLAAGIFKLYKLSMPIHDWKDLAEIACSAVEEALKHPEQSLKSEVGLAYIKMFYQLGIQAHLQYGQDVYPCSEFAPLWGSDCTLSPQDSRRLSYGFRLPTQIKITQQRAAASR